ncbi:hypothetical protein [Tessaracoccus flavus]|uniref:Uncharacterized protein n=1 Tax=Tessaracoccus flavus TaxID=1610493 RepID=A0A1Q2CFK5_9ACTN|nr:hypothetical protein [Tessaracoccus flavus]AQP44899.1 hypothetical protein RPIT_08935 [Tessaracoccus flavus]SDY98258.1 hypothetical protein SAMN05428934_107100 [Tessaracoccus flavus]
MNVALLEVLPGWPEAQTLSDVEMILLMVVGPLAFGAVVSLMVFGPKMARRGRGDAATSTEVERVEQR